MTLAAEYSHDTWGISGPDFLAATALLDKRSRAAALALPRTALHYGDRYTTRFTSWARTHPLESGGPAIDGIRFLRSRPAREQWSLPADVVSEWVDLEVGTRDRRVSIRRSSSGVAVGLRLPGNRTIVRALERRRPRMSLPTSGDDTANPRRPDAGVSVLTRLRGVMWSEGPCRVAPRTPCSVDAAGVTLFRWPRRSTHVPLETVDRFDVVLQEPLVGWDPYGNDLVERLALLTRDGDVVLISGRVHRRGPTLQACAQQLNNHIVRARRAGARPRAEVS